MKKYKTNKKYKKYIDNLIIYLKDIYKESEIEKENNTIKIEYLDNVDPNILDDQIESYNKINKNENIEAFLDYDLSSETIEECFYINFKLIKYISNNIKIEMNMYQDLYEEKIYLINDKKILKIKQYYNLTENEIHELYDIIEKENINNLIIEYIKDIVDEMYIKYENDNMLDHEFNRLYMLFYQILVV